MKDKGWQLALYLIGNPLWLFGVGAMIGSFVFQALALYDGRLSVVQSILVTELVFSLVIGSLWLRRDDRAGRFDLADLRAQARAGSSPRAARRRTRMHLDFDVDDLDAAEARVLAAGATRFDVPPNGHCRVSADPGRPPVLRVQPGRPRTGPAGGRGQPASRRSHPRG